MYTSYMSNSTLYLCTFSKIKFRDSTYNLLHYVPHNNDGLSIKFCNKLSGLPKMEHCFSEA